MPFSSTEPVDLIITGLNPGLKSVSLMELLHNRCGMGLKEAKQAVEHFLNNEEICVSALSFDEVAKIRTEIEALDALCR